MVRSRIERRRGVGNVEDFLVRRKRQAVWFIHFIGDDGQLSARWIETKNVAITKLALCFVALVVADYSVGGIREPDRAVGLYDKVVRRIQTFTLVTIHEHDLAPVGLSPADASAAMLTAQQPTLEIPVVPVLKIRGLAPNAHALLG